MIESVLDKTTNKQTHKRPPINWRVIYLNDDYTSFDFVCDTLQSFFDKTDIEASSLALHIHKIGRAVAGIYPREIAETKAIKVMSLAQECEYPLKLVLDPIEDEI